MNVTIAIGQLGSQFCNPAVNVERHLDWISQARERGARLIAFPELSLVGYYLREAVAEIALSLKNPHVQRIVDASDGIGVILGFIEKGEKCRYYNSAMICENGKIIGIHRKNHLPTYGMFEEGRYFEPGRTLKTHKLSWGTVGVVICEDAWYPNFVLRFNQKQIDILAIISASPVKGISQGTGINNTETNNAINRFYARNLQVPTLFANKIGYEHGIYFWGGSAVYSSGGKLDARASIYSEELLFSEIALSRKSESQQKLSNIVNKKIAMAINKE